VNWSAKDPTAKAVALVDGDGPTNKAATEQSRRERTPAFSLVQLYTRHEFNIQRMRDEYTPLNSVFNELTAASGPCNDDGSTTRFRVDRVSFFVRMPVIADCDIRRLARSVDTYLAAILHCWTEVLGPTFDGRSTHNPISVRSEE
jgi:hypothetical protein